MLTRSHTGSLLPRRRSGDTTARIWNLPPGPLPATPSPAVVLPHVARVEAKSKDVTTLDWNHDGSQLATGSYDGLARIWGKDGALGAGAGVW